jgi:hypothetical protein
MAEKFEMRGPGLFAEDVPGDEGPDAREVDSASLAWHIRNFSLEVSARRTKGTIASAKAYLLKVAFEGQLAATAPSPRWFVARAADEVKASRQRP